MADIDNVQIQGPAGVPDNIRRNERTSADADKFKEEMLRQMQQVNDPDTEQQKKRKQPAEEEQEEEVAETQPTPAAQVTPFNLDEQDKQISPLEMQSGEGKISPISSAQPTVPTSPMASFVMVPAADETEDDAGMWDDESASIFEVSSSSQAQTQTQPSYPIQQPPEEPPVQTPTPQPYPTTQTPVQQPPVQQQATQATTTQPADTEQQDQDQSQTSQTRRPLLPQPTLGEQPQTEKPSAPGTSEEDLSTTTLGEQEGIPALFEQMGKPQTTKPISPQQAEEMVAAEGGVSATPVLPPSEGSFEGDQGKKEKKDDGVPQGGGGVGGLPTPQMEMGGTAPMEPTAPPAYTSMHPQVLDMFERMAGVMTIMTDSKMTETVITLNSPKFASSVFYGTQIIIQEYTSAPKAFNIQLNGNPEAVALFQGNADDLMAAFQYGNYNFKVNRLDTGYLTDRPLFHRKEKAGGDKQDQSGTGS